MRSAPASTASWRWRGGLLRLGAAYLQHVALLAFAWWCIAEGEIRWAHAIPGIAIAAAAGVAVRPRAWRLRPRATVRFVTFFTTRSLAGGIDVARRALHPRLAITPLMSEFTFALAQPQARRFFATAMSLLPGTLAVALEGDRLRVHILDSTLLVDRDLREFEQRVGDLFGERVER